MNPYYRVAPYVTSWNLSGWCIEWYAPLCQVWSRTSGFYVTRWGACRALRRGKWRRG